MKPINVISWNILAPYLFTPETYSQYYDLKTITNDFRLTRTNKILKKLGKKNDIMLLQEVVDDWYFNNIQKTLSIVNHNSIYLNHTKHGILISWNQDRFTLVKKYTYFVNQHIKAKLSDEEHGIATKKVKIILICVLRDNLNKKDIFVVNYHFPCQFMYENIMNAHSKAVLDILKEVLSFYKETLKTAYVIFGSDTNSHPSTGTIGILKKEFVFGNLNEKKHTTFSQKNDNAEPFISILDQIMISPKLKFQLYDVLFYDEKRVSPNIKNPSDHNPIRAVIL